MMTIQDLAERFGISEKSVRRRLDILGPVLAPYLTTGRQNAILLNDSGVAVFDRLLQIERQDKLSPSAAAERVKRELQDSDKAVSGQGRSTVQSPPDGIGELVTVLSKQVEDLRAERDRLLSIIEQQGEQLRALAPGPKPQSSQDGNPAGKLTRWQALKIAILGR
ncbi:MAG: hypothetical protein QXP01_00765 [Candidatus Hadarchaeum sp.]